jgi:ribA/ribD-fused uncharacterized protein
MKNYVIKNNIALFFGSCLSQWYKCPIFIKASVYVNGRDYKDGYRFQDITFNCAEQAMMYCKAECFDDQDIMGQVLKADSSKEQKALGRKIKNFNEEKWGKIKFATVVGINKLKFEQNPELKKILTEDLKNYLIAEASPYDKIWGIGLGADNPKAWDVKTWEGQNLLGKALMKVRDEMSN